MIERRYPIVGQGFVPKTEGGDGDLIVSYSRKPKSLGRIRTKNPKGPPITVYNEQYLIGRNMTVSINGVVAKFKRFPQSRFPRPYTEFNHEKV